jgi:hypothetical protein
MRLLLLCFLAGFLPTKAMAAIDFSLSNAIVNDTSITLDASMSGITNNYYLQGSLRSVGSSKYFGSTIGSNGGWVDYVSSPEKEFISSNFFATNIQNASWSGQLKMRYFVDDDNYVGPGLYELKFRRFTGGSTSAAGESNILLINLTATIPSPSPSPTSTPTPSPTPSPSPTPTRTPTPPPTPKPSPSLTPSILPLSSDPVGTVAGESTKIDLSGFGILASPNPPTGGDGGSPTHLTLNPSRAKLVIAIGAGLVLISVAGFFLYRRIIAK